MKRAMQQVETLRKVTYKCSLEVSLHIAIASLLMLMQSTNMDRNSSDVSCHFGESHSTRSLQNASVGFVRWFVLFDDIAAKLSRIWAFHCDCHSRARLKPDEERAIGCDSILQLPRDWFLFNSHDDCGRDNQRDSRAGWSLWYGLSALKLVVTDAVQLLRPLFLPLVRRCQMPNCR